jgi:hypothetical protein
MITYPYIYEALIVSGSDADPKGLNRVKVRVHKVHGNTPEVFLPWANCGSVGGGSPDTGDAQKYITGSSVYVMFEEGDVSMPVVIFGLVKKPSENHTYGVDGWKPVTGSLTDIPKEAQSSTVRVVFKSPKGATLYYDEVDEGEKMVLVDRAGQMVEMVSPVLGIENETNNARRGNATVAEGTQLDYAQMSGPAYIKATDLSGNCVLLHSEENEERVEFNNPAFKNKQVMGKDGLRWDILGGKADGGITIIVDETGVKVNDQYLASESVVNWIKAFESKFVISTKPGSQAPLFPEALAEFEAQYEASVNNSGMKTRL